MFGQVKSFQNCGYIGFGLAGMREDVYMKMSIRKFQGRMSEPIFADNRRMKVGVRRLVCNLYDKAGVFSVQNKLGGGGGVQSYRLQQHLPKYTVPSSCAGKLPSQYAQKYWMQKFIVQAIHTVDTSPCWAVQMGTIYAHGAVSGQGFYIFSTESNHLLFGSTCNISGLTTRCMKFSYKNMKMQGEMICM